jgi:ABC-type transport system involved in cytochrome bd biosynthesis fused ATPase/permease subunit
MAVREALQRLMRGKTCLMITHDLEAAAAADRVLILENGRVSVHRNELVSVA